MMVSSRCILLLLFCFMSFASRQGRELSLDDMGATIPEDLDDYNIKNNQAFVENVERSLNEALAKDEVCAITYESLFEEGKLRDGVCALADDAERATLHLYFCTAILNWIDRGNRADPINPGRQITRNMLVPLSHLETPLDVLFEKEQTLSAYTSRYIIAFMDQYPWVFTDEQLQRWTVDKYNAPITVTAFSNMMRAVCNCNLDAKCWGFKRCVGDDAGYLCTSNQGGSCGTLLQCSTIPGPSVKGFFDMVRDLSNDNQFVDGLSSDNLKMQLLMCFAGGRFAGRGFGRP
eukprot:TRINITY_DN4173_c0_g5_i1.p1 TRINITY_DN4173_c0_g5~~TRINITY_DN4173_c0_g5_i1.p1  ORF type:complete len:290 (-),score=36.94 TRINITY_DN4173_c0_g5_i1:193-1062(-)